MENSWKVVERIFMATAWLGFAFVFCALTFVAMTFVFEMPWSSDKFWFYRWQTLIAGILAVLAAGFTIRQMQISDRKQQSRHEDLLNLNLRTDKLLLERAAIPLTYYLREVISELDDVLRIYKAENNQPAAFYRSMLEEFRKFLDLIDSEDITKAQHLFAPLLHQTVRSAKREAKILEAGMTAIQLELSSMEHPMFVSHNAMPASMEKACSAYANTKFYANLMADDLDELLSSYA
ncbi:hypothetical protein [Phyllobacterium sp. 22552]|uniref:hypothetical protein n=1 Tax=Phyllobacterium sp. 22552 TaxID=3453941 RepID=UPI003F851DE0